MKKPIALWMTDPHMSDETIEVNRSIYLQVLQLCIDNEIPAVIIGGDVFNSRKGQSEPVLTTFSQIIGLFQQQAITINIIPGNHDKSDYTSEDSFLNAYAGWDYFVLHRNYQFFDHSAGGLRLHFIPYFDESLAYEKYLQQATDNIRFDFKNLLFTHIAIKGVTNNDGTKVDNDLNARRFKDFFKVLVGHYHNRQLISNNILYTGSTHQANFGEDEEKGVTIIYDDGSISHVKLDTPKYITIVLESKDKGLTIPPPLNINDHYRAKFKYKPDSTEVQKLQQRGFKVVTDFEIQHVDHIQDVKTQFSQGDILEYFNQWCDEKGIKDKDFGIKQLQS